MKKQHNSISDLPARKRRAYFMPSTPKKISVLALSAVSAWTSGAAETNLGIHGGPAARRN